MLMLTVIKSRITDEKFLEINTVKLLYLSHLHEDHISLAVWHYFLKIFHILMEKIENILKKAVFEVAVIALISELFYK